MGRNKSELRTITGDIAIIGVGDFGCETLEHFSFKQGNTPLLIRVNWFDRLPELNNEFIHIVLDEEFRGKVLGDPISAGRAMASITPEIINLLQHVAFVVVIAQPGDGVGSGGTTALAEMLNRSTIPFLSILALPDVDSVGRKRHMTARNTISDLCVMRETPVVFDQTDFPGYYNAFKLSVIDKVQTLLDALTPSMIPLDFNRIRNALTGSSESALATARAVGADRSIEAAENILADTSVEEFLGKPASVLLHIQSGEALSLYEIDRVANCITSGWGADLDLTYGVGEGGCSDGEIRLGLIVGTHIDDQEIESKIIEDRRDNVELLIAESFSNLRSSSKTL